MNLPDHQPPSPPSRKPSQVIRRRQMHMAVLARAERGDLQALLGTLDPQPAFSMLKPPETGTVMVEGRAGGAGSRFNLGEATLTRCAIRLESGTIGFCHALGRDKEKARLAALLEAALQDEPDGGPLHAGLNEIAARQRAAKALASRKAAASKVEFFTMVRGE